MRSRGDTPNGCPHCSRRSTLVEAFLLTAFLRRYVTNRVRRRRFTAMNGAARLYAKVGVSIA